MIRLPLRSIPLNRILLASALAAFASAPPLSAQSQDAVSWDFESRDLRGWTATGAAFLEQPVQGMMQQERTGVPLGQQGAYLVSSYHPTRGDAATGTLTSEPFEIPLGSIGFLVGGGSGTDTRVELLVVDPMQGERRVRSASGEGRETMRRVDWEVGEFAGRQGRIRIVDEAAGAHVNADDFRFGVLRPEPGPITVPELRGRLVAEAESLLSQSGLVLVRGREVPSDRPRGTVLAQTPGPGTPVTSGTRVEVELAVWISVPGVTERGIEAARRSLVDAGLVLGEVTRRYSATAPGTILSQDPAAGQEVPPGTRVNVAMSTWPTVPDLTGLDSLRARAVLEADSLRLGGTTIRPSRARRGTVVGQSPPSGRELPPRSLVEVEVAGGVAVPNLFGMRVSEASARLSRDTLRAGSQSLELSRQPVGTVIRQSPAPDSMVLTGTVVNLWVAQGVPVPAVTGTRLQEARRRLEAGRLVLGEVDEEPSAEPIGTVIGQALPPDSTVPLETPVDVTLARGVPVPAVLGISRLAARQRLESAGFEEGRVTMERSTSPPGTVLGQTPEAGTLLPLESTVALLLAEGVPVPSLFGLDSTRALQRLEETGLGVGAMASEPSPAPMGSVIRQDPVADEVVALATPVEIVFAEGVPVPDLVRTSGEEALSLLQGQGLELRAVDRRWSLAAKGAVLEQEPPPGTLLPLQTTVEVVVARHIPAGWILAITALLGGGLLLMRRRRAATAGAVAPAGGGRARKKEKAPKREKAPRGAKAAAAPVAVAGVVLDVRGRPDPGTQGFEGGEAPEVAFELRRRAVVDPGRRATNLQGPPIAGERIKGSDPSQEPDRG